MAKTCNKTSELVISQTIPVPCKSTGTADIIGFGSSGVVILRNRINPQDQSVVASFGQNAGGWRIDRHVRLLADTTGDGNKDIVGFGEDGVYVSVNKGNNMFGAPKKVKDDFGYTAGNWRVEHHLRFMADLRNTGRADIIGFGDSGVYISLNNGDGTFGPTQLAAKDFGFDFWKLDKHLRFLADVNGNGLLDIVGFGDNQVYVALNNGNGTFQPAKGVLVDLCYDQTWRVDKHPRYVVDLTGDGKPDLIGFGDPGVYVSLNKGDGTFGPARLVISDFCTNTEWRSDQHQRSVADITGDGRADIVGFGINGVYVAISNGDGTFQPIKFVLNQFGYDGSWRVNKHLRFLADITGNGRADIIGFGTQAVYVSYNDGKGGFSASVIIINDFGSDSPGWSIDTAVKYVANLYN